MSRSHHFFGVLAPAAIAIALAGCSPAKANPAEVQARFVTAAKTLDGAERDRALAEIVPNATVEGWTGTLDTVARNSSGRLYVAIRVAEGVRFSTLIQTSADFGAGTLIHKSNPLYETLAGLRRGERVRFSAELARKPEGGFVVLNYATGGAIGLGAYLFRLTAVEALPEGAS